MLLKTNFEMTERRRRRRRRRPKVVPRASADFIWQLKIYVCQVGWQAMMSPWPIALKSDVRCYTSSVLVWLRRK